MNIVIGYVETHKRAETEALVKDLEVIPRKTIQYRESTLTEMDVDDVIERHPALVLVDELAHTNAPGSRHLKRYLDVEDLLDAGINVYMIFCDFSYKTREKFLHIVNCEDRYGEKLM